MDFEQALPVVKMTPAELAQFAWVSLPGVLTGLAVAMILLYLRGKAVGMRQPDAPKTVRGVLAWPLYLICRLQVWYIIAGGLLLATQMMPFGSEVRHVLREGFTLLSILQLGMLLSAFANDGARQYLKRSKADGSRTLLVNMLVTAGVALIWALMLLMGMNTVGINVTALVAGLGLGGIAIAFATKNILENVLASFAIVMDPPFVIGDFVQSGDVSGTVERITLKNVQIRTLGGEQVVVPNSDLLNGRIRNFSRLRERRVEARFGIGYATLTAARMEKIPQIIREAVEAQGAKKARFDRAHVTTLGDMGVNFEAVYYIPTSDYYTFMDVQQNVTLSIYKGLEKLGVKLALNPRMGTANDLAATDLLLSGKAAAKSGK